MIHELMDGKNNIMIDIECLSLKPEATIMAIGACRFSIDGITDKLYVEVDIEGQPHNLIDASTLHWWSVTNPVLLAQMITSPKRVSLDEALHKLHVFSNPASGIPPIYWANSPTFDCIMLERNAKIVGRPFPKFRQWRDVRTVLKLFGYEKNLNNHNALDDCVNQSLALIEVMKGLIP